MFGAFRSRNYALFWTGSFVSNVGTWMQSVALGWLVYEMTGAASWLGTVSFAANAPSLFVGLIGGAVADRTDRRFVLVATQAAAALAAAALAGLTVHGSLEIWQVIVIALASGVAQSFYTPVVHATIPALVPAEDLMNAVSLNSVQFNLARVLGPVIAGFTYARIGPGGCFTLNAASFVVLALLLTRLRLPPQRPAPPASILRQLMEGIRYVRSEPAIVTILGFAAAMSLFAFPYIVLMPAVASDVLHLGPEGLGMMMALLGGGAVIGGLALGAVGDVGRKTMLAVTSGAILATSIVGFSFVTTLRAAAPILLTLGVLQITCVASLNAALQVIVDDSLRGRVMSMLSFAFFGLSTLGSVILGAIGDRIGIAAALRLGGFVVLGIAVLVLIRWPPPKERPRSGDRGLSTSRNEVSLSSR